MRSALPSAVPQGLGPQVLLKIVELINEELSGNAAAKAYTYHMGYQLLKEGHEGALVYAEKVGAWERVTWPWEALEEITVAEGTDSWVGQLLRQDVAEKAL